MLFQSRDFYGENIPGTMRELEERKVTRLIAFMSAGLFDSIGDLAGGGYGSVIRYWRTNRASKQVVFRTERHRSLPIYTSGVSFYPEKNADVVADCVLAGARLLDAEEPSACYGKSDSGLWYVSIGWSEYYMGFIHGYVLSGEKEVSTRVDSL